MKMTVNSDEISSDKKDMLKINNKDSLRAYSAPQLFILGDVRQITQGGSFVTSDSGPGTGINPNL